MQNSIFEWIEYQYKLRQTIRTAIIFLNNKGAKEQCNHQKLHTENCKANIFHSTLFFQFTFFVSLSHFFAIECMCAFVNVFSHIHFGLLILNHYEIDANTSNKLWGQLNKVYVFVWMSFHFVGDSSPEKESEWLGFFFHSFHSFLFCLVPQNLRCAGVCWILRFIQLFAHIHYYLCSGGRAHSLLFVHSHFHLVCAGIKRA